uniref:Uncharacterized protein n=1 Tax=Anguilla anguilla TaxID=7936 RepID=A0A0E9X6U5_ANGAN
MCSLDVQELSYICSPWSQSRHNLCIINLCFYYVFQLVFSVTRPGVIRRGDF